MMHKNLSSANIRNNGLKVTISYFDDETNESFTRNYNNSAPIHEDLARRIHNLKPYLLTVLKVDISEMVVNGFQIVTKGDRKKVYFYAGIYDADGNCSMNTTVRVQVGDSAVLMPNLLEADLERCASEVMLYIEGGKRLGLDHGLMPVSATPQPSVIQPSANFNCFEA